jgi:hypothetical protein
MNLPSDEQSIIINHVKDKKNVIVDACAGSGKSTTVLSMAKLLNRRKFLQLTYNSVLRHEVKDKIKSLKLRNINVHTYHSLAVRYYLSNAYTDSGIRKILHTNMPPRDFINHIDVLVIDEAQDMTMLYFELIVKFLRDFEKKIQIVVMGDYKQGLYEFKGSDIRFLTKANDIWRKFPQLKYKTFVNTTLKMSYRITDPIKDFVNKVMLDENRMESCKIGEPVTYIKRDQRQTERIIVSIILDLLNNGAKPSDIFILAGSVKGANSKIRKIENALVSSNIPCHIPMFEVDQMDERVINGKVGIATFHSVKGRQRRFVFIVGFDSNYFDFYGRNLPVHECPNTLYVACTRARERLFLFESDDFNTDRPLDFIKYGHYDMINADFVNFNGMPRSIFYLKDREQSLIGYTQKVTPSDLIKFIPEKVLDNITIILDKIFTNEQEIGEVFDIPAIIQTSNNLFEEVSDLNGIAIPCIYYDYLNNLQDNENKSNVLYDMIQHYSLSLDKKHNYLHNIIDNFLEKDFNSVNDYLFASNIFKALDEQLYFKLKQISKDDCSWLLEEDIEKCKHRLDSVIKKDFEKTKPIIEFNIIHCSEEEKHINIDKVLEGSTKNKLRFTARADLVTESTVYELKCTNEISIDHQIQVVIYAWLWKLTYPEDDKVFKIFNIKTGELKVLNSDFDTLNFIVIDIIKGKFDEFFSKDDQKFINDCIDVYNKN